MRGPILVLTLSMTLTACGDGGGGSGGAGGVGGNGGGGGSGPVARFRAPATTPVDIGEVPFPSDLYRDGSGQIRIGAFPGQLQQQMQIAMQAGWSTQDGWGVATGVFFKIDGAIDPATVAGSVHLYDLESGDEVPVLVGTNDAQSVIAGVPAPGHVLRDAHRYAAVLTDDPRAPSAGPNLTASQDFIVLRSATGAPADPRLAAAFAVVDPALRAASAKGIAREHVVAATSYGTQSLLAPMEKLRASLDASAPAAISQILKVYGVTDLDQILGHPANSTDVGLDTPGTTTMYAVPHDHLGWIIHGMIRVKSFGPAAAGQQGLFTLDAGGTPQVKALVDVPFTLTLPRTNCCTNLPLVVFQHGVTETRDRLLDQADYLGAEGIAVVGIDFLFHGSRALNPTDTVNNITREHCASAPCDYMGDQQGLTAPIGFFNLAGDAQVVADDPRAGRDNLREMAAEVMQLVRTLQDGDLSPITSAQGAPAQLSFRPGGVGFMAQSLGTFFGPVLASVDSRFGALVLCSAGGGMMVPTVVMSPGFGLGFGVAFFENGFGIRGEFDTATRDARFHPSLALYQTVYEPGDGLAFAPYVTRDPSHRGNTPAHVLVTQAYRDEAVPNQSSEPLAAELGLTRVTLSITTPGLRFAMLPEQPAPFAPAGGLTAAFVQYHPATHGLIQFTYEYSTWGYEEIFPPFQALQQPMPIPGGANPTAQAHRQVGRFFADYFAGAQPTVIDPFVP